MPETKTTKPGYKTSEFWLTTAGMVVGTLIASGAVAVESGTMKALSFIAASLGTLGYTVIRGKLKAGPE